VTEYIFPTSPEEALAALAERPGRAIIIAGGTDVLPDLEKGKWRPDRLVDITRIPELGRIDIAGDWVTVGAAVPFVALREHPHLAARVHALADAAASVGARPIQTSATWAGNLVQAMPAADGAIIAVALDAEAEVLDATGVSWRRVADLYLGPGRSKIDPTGQLLTRIRFPAPAGAWGSAWRRVGRRPSLVLPTLNCAATVRLEGGRIAAATVAMGPVGPCPMRAGDAEAFLRGQPPTPEVFAEAAQLALCHAQPRSSPLRASREHRLAVLPALVEQALTQATVRAGQAAPVRARPANYRSGQ
jgi:carbon-monoxide dehydrogenase medium subunit